MPRKPSDWYRPIPEHPGYALSRDGRVFGSFTGKWRELKRWDGKVRFNQPLVFFRLYRTGDDGVRRQYNADLRDLLMATFHGPRPTPKHVVRRRDTSKHWRDSLHADNLYWGLPHDGLKPTGKSRQRLTDQQVRAWRHDLRADGWDVAKIKGWAAAARVGYSVVANAVAGVHFRHLNATNPPAPRPAVGNRRAWADRIRVVKLTPADKATIRRRLGRGERVAVVHADYQHVTRDYIRQLRGA